MAWQIMYVSRKGTDILLLLSSYNIMIPLFPILLLFLKQINDIGCWKKTLHQRDPLRDYVFLLYQDTFLMCSK